MFTVLFLTAWFVLATMTAAQADPVSTVIATGLLGAAAQGTFVFSATVSVLNFAIGVGISYASQALLGKKQDSAVGGMSGTLQLGGIVPRSFIVGRSATAGSLSYAGTWGKSGKTPNAYLTEVIPVSDIRVKGLVGLYVDDAKVEIDYSNTSYGDQGFPVPAYADGSDNRMWVKFYDGTQTVADPFLIEKFGSDPNYPYTADMVGFGVAYAVVTTQYNTELFSGYPVFKFEIEGGLWYDPRLDTTNGGSGPQRWNDPSTWTYTDNPAVILYNILRGLYFGGKWFYGLQALVASRLPNGSWFAAMNECDLQVPKAGGGTETQYRCGGEISVNTKVYDAVQALLTACNGRLAEIGGVYKLSVGAANAAVVAFDDEMLESTDPQLLDPFPSIEATINGIAATYPEPEEGYAPKDAPARYDADLEAADGDRRLAADVSYDLVPYKEQVQRLMLSALHEARRFRKHTVVAGPWAWILEPNDIVAWTSERNGYISKLFRVDAVTDQADLNIGLVLVEVDPADYDWNPDTDYIPVPVNPVVVGYPTPQPMYGWQAFPAQYLDANGNTRRPSIGIAYAGGMTNVRAIRVQVREAWGVKKIAFDGELPYVAPLNQSYSVTLNALLLPDSNYEASGQYIMRGGGPSTPSAWLPVKTDNILFGPLDIYPINIGQLNGDVTKVTEWLGNSLRYVQEELDRIGKLATEQDASKTLDKRQLRTEVSATAAGLRADYTLQILAAVGPGSAIVSRIEQLEVQVNNDIAQAVDLLSTEISTVNGKVTANAQAITALSATVGEVSASVNIRGQAEASPGGGWARWGVQVKTGSDNTWSSGVFFIDVNGGTSRAVFNVDQFIVTNGSDSQAPLTFINGELALQVARIRTAIVEKLSTFSGKTNFGILAPGVEGLEVIY
ncbi:phage tail protein [Phyllobacterium phragmitis]|uniref:Phage tail protein n=1 Tax=Phyllobacterium phragmitis TaxID=2670329 RepID=A0A2S9INU7_9HYPH|nr:phage tail protein [Phyllobacterium phragmitis]PRD42185.1 phage tail protein [Phyllobacterium phragmitis]